MGYENGEWEFSCLGCPLFRDPGAMEITENTLSIIVEWYWEKDVTFTCVTSGYLSSSKSCRELLERVY